MARGAVAEGTYVRFATRLGAGPGESQAALRIIHGRLGFKFLPDAISYVDVDLRHVQGHRQVTDAYLAALAAREAGGVLAALDHGLVAELGESTPWSPRSEAPRAATPSLCWLRRPDPACLVPT